MLRMCIINRRFWGSGDDSFEGRQTLGDHLGGLARFGLGLIRLGFKVWGR